MVGYWQAEVAASGLGSRTKDPVAGVAPPDLEVLAALEGPAAEEAAGPTMMSREARELLLSGDGMEGLQRWKVTPALPVHIVQSCFAITRSPSCTTATGDLQCHARLTMHIWPTKCCSSLPQ